MEEPIPQDKFWLTKYFYTDIRLAFLKYFLTFNSCFHFKEHTGYYCSTRYLKKMRSEFSKLNKEYEKAKNSFDFEQVAEIEMGNFKLN